MERKLNMAQKSFETLLVVLLDLSSDYFYGFTVSSVQALCFTIEISFQIPAVLKSTCGLSR